LYFDLLGQNTKNILLLCDQEWSHNKRKRQAAKKKKTEFYCIYIEYRKIRGIRL
jgi:hypothetical protein